MRIETVFVVALAAWGLCGCSPIKYQTPPVVTDVRMEGGRLLVEKCELETDSPTLPTFTKVECKTTEVGTAGKP